MAVIRMIVIFLLGVGFAAGAYMTGVAQQIPGYFNHLSHMNEAPFLGARSARVALNISSTSRGDRSACPPEYRVLNRTGGPVYLSLGRQRFPSRDGIVLPPGGVLDPANDLHANDRFTAVDDPESCSDLVDIDINTR